MNDKYAASSIYSATGAISDTFILKNHPASFGSAFTKLGVSTIA